MAVDCLSEMSSRSGKQQTEEPMAMSCLRELENNLDQVFGRHNLLPSRKTFLSRLHKPLQAVILIAGF